MDVICWDTELKDNALVDQSRRKRGLKIICLYLDVWMLKGLIFQKKN